ncbi:MAG: peptidase M64 [Bacteroidales bacterium]|nr:peptidase M64 [Bacteroidales bacterium]
MKKTLLSVALALLLALNGFAAGFDSHFKNSTLRLDFVLAGDASHQDVYLQEICRTGQWAGRRGHLDSLLLEGNAQVFVRSLEGQLLYAQSFSTLFQEWLTTEEAARVAKAFECPVLIPEPRSKVKVELRLNNHHRCKAAALEFVLDPEDVLIRKVADGGMPCKTLMDGGALDSHYDIVIVAEGYTDAEQEKFFADAFRLNSFLFSHNPFAQHASRFNVRALFAPSGDSGPSEPAKGIWKNTATATNYDTFYMERYLTTSSLRKVHDVLGTVPFEQIILLVNTERYGGGGIFNNITLSTADHPFAPVVFVHEFGHSFAGLGDEYDYGEDGLEDPTYPAGVEPWEPNITTLTDFASKWEDMLPAGVQIPTEPGALMKNYDLRRIWNTLTDKQKHEINTKLGVYQGAGYRTSGVYRPVQECRMRINECEEFCPVCSRAIVRMIEFCTTK